MKQISYIIHRTAVALCIGLFILATAPEALSQRSPLDTTHVNSQDASKRNARDKSKAENPDKGDRAIYIGVLGGAGYYDVSFDPSYGTTGDISPVFGALFRYESPVNKSIDVELRYRSAGWQNKDLYIRDLSIIEMPILAHVSFGQKKTKAFFTLGETVTFIVSEKEEILDASSNPVFGNQPIDNKVGFALNLGVGVIRHLSKGAVQFEIRGTFTLTNLYKTGNELLIQNSNAYFIEGAVQYLFRVK